MIKKYSLMALQKTINHAMSLDENTPSRIEKLHGKTIEMVITPLNVNFFIAFEQQQLLLLDQSPQKPDTIIRSSPLGLIRLSFLPVSKARSLFNDKIHVSGDIETGEQLKKLFDELDIDWEGHLAHFTGDVVAHQFGLLFRKGLSFQQKTRKAVRDNITGFVQEELRLFPPREEMEDFLADVDQLSLDVERMDARVQQLMAFYEIN